MTIDGTNVAFSDRDKVYLGHLYFLTTSTGKYYNNRFLGRGGNGTAFLVTCSDGDYAGLQMVLKMFHRISDDLRRDAFIKEIDRLKGLHHEAVVRVFDDGVYENNGQSYPFMLTEFLPQTVRQLLTQRQVDRLQAIRIALNCSSALRYIHGQQHPIVHRDIKPENILLSESGAKLADFGLAKDLEALILRPAAQVAQSDEATPRERQQPHGPEQSALEDPTQMPGMPRMYRTPELIKRASDRNYQLTTASDIYQLGTVFYELLTGKNPQLPSKDIHEEIKLDLRRIPGKQGTDLLTLIKEMLAEHPGDRPNAADCLSRIDKIHREFCESLKRVSGDFC